jgi:hypothetical protein
MTMDRSIRKVNLIYPVIRIFPPAHISVTVPLMTSIQFQSGGSFVLNAIIDEPKIFAHGTHAPVLMIPVAFQNIAVDIVRGVGE